VKAARRAIPIFKEAGISVKVLSLKPYKDPDEFIKHMGAEAFQQRIDQAENSFLFEIDVLSREYEMSDPEQQTAFWHMVTEKLAGFTD
jgi:DNA primase